MKRLGGEHSISFSLFAKKDQQLQPCSIESGPVAIGKGAAGATTACVGVFATSLGVELQSSLRDLLAFEWEVWRVM
jgi:hypothetical protein